MRLFPLVRSQYGRTALKAVQAVSRTLKKLMLCENNKWFLGKCREFKVSPKFLQLKFHWNVSSKNRTSLDKSKFEFDKKVLNIMIKEAHSKYRRLCTLLDDSVVNLLQLLPSDLVDRIINNEKEMNNKASLTTRENQTRKLEQLRAQHFSTDVNNFHVCWKKWIINMSSKNVPENVLKVLSLGPKFCFQDHTNKQGKGIRKLAELFNVDDLIANLESKIKYESDDCKKEIRTKTVNVISNFLTGVNSGKTRNIVTKKMSPQDVNLLCYLNKSIYEARKFLAENKDLVVIEADKSSKTVILDANVYKEKMLLLLNDKNTYRLIKRDLSNTQQLKNNAMVNNWFKNKFIEERIRDNLLIKDALPPKIYGLVKTHKPNMPLRPIVSCIQSPFYQMSKYLVNILSKIVGKNKYHIKDSFQFQRSIKHLKVPENHILASFDVVSLYTCIPIDLAIKVVEKNWAKIKSHTKLPQSEFLYALKVCLNSTFFQYEDHFYEQIEGLAMGAPVSACIANLVMEHVESEVLSKCKGKFQYYKRFVDDSIICVHKDKCQEVLDQFNSYHPSFKFTSEVEKNLSLNFLDLTIDHKLGTKIQTQWYQKSIHSGRYLNYLSAVPFHQKVNVVKNIVSRVLNLTDKCYIKERLNVVEQLLLSNGYPLIFLKKQMRECHFMIKNKVKNVPKTQFVAEKVIKMSYVSGLSETLKKKLEPFGMQAVFKNRPVGLFSRLKAKVPTVKKSNVVYQINCKDCPGTYIGHTKRYLQDRIKSHKYDKNEKTALHQHALDNDHIFDFDNPSILVNEKNMQARLIHEAIQIKKCPTAVNSRSDTQCLSSMYQPFL